MHVANYKCIYYGSKADSKSVWHVVQMWTIIINNYFDTTLLLFFTLMGNDVMHKPWHAHMQEWKSPLQLTKMPR